MRVLGIDTATSTASVALVEDDQLIGEEICDDLSASKNGTLPHVKGNRAEVILPLIESTLSKTRITVADLSGIAISIGPGSFTGLRIGLATVKGVAYDLGLPVVGVSTLLANAARVTGFDGLLCSLLDARKGEVYFVLFNRSGEILSQLNAEAVASIADAMDSISENHHSSDGASLLFVGDGVKVHEKLIRSHFGTKARLSTGEDYRSVASQVAQLACRRILGQSADDVGTLVPVYLRRSTAEDKKYFV
jgi:tRNA threonylcarbamoyladenosine biosynthesis protein TsaB